MKVAVITGAASGIGLALSEVNLNQGITVVMVDKNELKLKKEAERLLKEFPNKLQAISCDVTQPEAVLRLAKQIASELGRIDWIYNNAGIIGPLAPIWDVCPKQIEQVMEVNLYGMIHIIQTFMPFLFKQQFRSHIINIASLYALCSGSQTAAYAMSKHAVLALSESLYFDLTRLQKPVDVSVVFPSFTDTSLLSQDSQDKAPLHQALKSLLSHGRPAMDIAQYIVQAIEQKQFYIFPDKEVKDYSEKRTKALILEEYPYISSIERLVNALLKRQEYTQDTWKC